MRKKYDPLDDRASDFLFWLVPRFIIGVFVLMLVGFVAASVIGFNIVGEVGERGLREVLSDIWEGPKE